MLTSSGVERTQDPVRDTVSFADQVRPILESHCSDCHMSGSRRGNFSLDSREMMLASRGAVIPGDSAGSRLIHLVRGNDPDFIMPMRGDLLTAAQVAVLVRWIDQGAAWDDGPDQEQPTHPHLVAQPVVVPAPRDGIVHPIDLLLESYFVEQHQEPTALIDDITFLRRASLDIVGLLPASVWIAEFQRDQHPQKREHAVDRLLDDDEAYAAHWMTFWNDLLRNDYAGTGYIDGGRVQITEWLYEALRENMPYDQFVSELVNPGERSAGFSRGIRWRGEASASQRWELQFARNVSQVFLGVNMKCASCHDSFVDSWKLADAYGMAAIIADEPMEMFRCDLPTGKFATPGFLFAEVGDIDPTAEKSQRLSMLASLLTSHAGGRTSRTIVNRIWARMMGRGLVDDVDSMENDAWNEHVLNFLANHLVDHDYDLKQTIRLIATSAAYQRHAAPAMPEGDFVFRGPTPQRMTAEQFIDAVWQLTGAAPNQISAPLGDRAAELRARASLIHASPLMRSLGRPAREQVVSIRPNSLTTLQALELSNGHELAQMIKKGSVQIAALHEDCDELVDHVFTAALSRKPSARERAVARELLGDEMGTEQVADFLWAVIMLPEFQLVR